ncbi:ThiF family adenylyltransferase [Catellatospora sp. NPDC049609]|uniref:ThiF family adenylyltransferase n=1 Tax=Catellatospora sp. NPDC049609 TaxID=3155505 RepID=UPI00342D89C4
MWDDVSAHLFRDDRDEHGGVILAGLAPGPRGPRLLGRELILARDGIDYVPGTTGYRALSAAFVRDATLRAHDERLAYLAFHNHHGTTTVGFSRTDMASHESGYPALRQITGQVVGGLVLTPQAAAGDLWLPDRARIPLAELVVPGGILARMRPRPTATSVPDSRWNRQALVLGDRGQDILRRMRIAVAGLGGAGSILVEFLARLGVGYLVLIDDDIVETTNLSRLIAARHGDIGRPKTEPAARNARRANPDIKLTLIDEAIQSPRAQAELSQSDWIFLAADTHAARHWVNAIGHQYLIPMTQVGVKIPVTEDGTVGQIHAVSRLFLPGEGCMWCNGLVDPTQLAIDMAPSQQREAAQYVPEMPAAAVISLNGTATMEAVNHFLFAATGLHTTEDAIYSTLALPRTRERYLQRQQQRSGCTWCTTAGVLARGGATLL